MPACKSGFVYVLTNRAMPGLVKIGHSTRLVGDRAKQLFTTGIPVPFDVHTQLMTTSPKAAEREAHMLLASCRVGANREFFRLSPEVAADTMRRAVLTVDGIQAWVRRADVHRVSAGDRLTLRLRAQQVFVLIVYPQLLGSSAQVMDVWQAHADCDSLELMGTDETRYVAGLGDNDDEGTNDPVPHLDRDEMVPNATIIGRERLVPGDRLMWIEVDRGGDEHVWTTFEASSYCQVVCRTESPQFTFDGHPLMLNNLTMDLPAGLRGPLREVLDLPFPRNWAPRLPVEPLAGTHDASPSYWLDPLASPVRGAKPRPR